MATHGSGASAAELDGLPLHGWPEAGLRWREAVLACCEPGKAQRMTELMVDGYPRGGVGCLLPSYSFDDDDEAAMLWGASERRLFLAVQAGQLRVTANDPENGFAEWVAPPNLGELIRRGLMAIRALPPDQLRERHSEAVSPKQRIDQCLLLSPDGRRLSDLRSREVRYLVELSVKPGVAVAAPVGVAVAVPEAAAPAAVPAPPGVAFLSPPQQLARRVAAARYDEVARWILAGLSAHPERRKAGWREAARHRHRELSKRDFDDRIWPLVTARCPDLAKAGRPTKDSEGQQQEARAGRASGATTPARVR